MAIFMLDCDSVTSSASSINSLVTQFSQLADSVNGYDTSCEDGFDFAGGKAAIAANIEACTTKVQNTVKLVEGVVTSHTTLQNSFTLEQNGSSESETQNKETTGTIGTNSGTTGTNNGTYNSSTTGTNNGTYNSSTTGTNNGSYGTGSGTSYGGGNSGYSAGSGAGVAAGVGAGIASSGGSTGGGSHVTTSGTSTQNPVDVTGKVNAVDQVTVDVDKLDPENRTQFITGMTYNHAGYATFEDKYVIVCDTTLANVGDNIIFTKPDGTKIDCVVGAVVDYSQEYKGNVSFIVNNNWNAQSTSNLTFDLTNMKITNNGQYVIRKG